MIRNYLKIAWRSLWKNKTSSFIKMMSSIGKFVYKNSKIPKRGFFTVIDQATTAYRQCLGMNRVELKPGIRFNVPFIHDIRVVDMREGNISVKHLNAYTKDNVPVTLSGTLFYKVFDAEKVCFGVQNFSESVRSVGESTVRSVVGNFEYDKIISDRNTITQQLNTTIANSIKNWGVDCTRFEIQEFKPQNVNVAHQLELQMEAERKRRQNVLITEAEIKTSDGKRQSTILASEGELVAKKNVADANKYTLDTETEAIKSQLDILTIAFTTQLEPRRL